MYNRKSCEIYTILFKTHPHQCLHTFAYIHTFYNNRAYMHSYCSFANHYFIIFSLTQSDSIPCSSLFFSFSSHTLSLFIYTANQPSTHHHSTNATDHHSTNATHHHHFTTHKNPTINSIENQGKIQTHPMEKPKSTKIRLKINRNQI